MKCVLLTPTQAQAFELFMSGNTTVEVAKAMHIEPCSATYHKKVLLKKYGYPNMEKLIVDYWRYK